MSMDFDCSYDGDSDVHNGNGSKLKSRRRSKKHRKDHKRRSPSPAKAKNHKKTFGDEDDFIQNEHSSESQAQHAHRVAESIRGSQASSHRHNQQAKVRYQPLE